MLNVYASSHPLVAHKLTMLRDKSTDPTTFRQLVREIAVLLTYETTADLLVERKQIETPLLPFQGVELAENIGLIPILRAGLGMVGSI